MKIQNYWEKKMKDLDRAFDMVMEFMDLLTNDQLDKIELASSQTLFERYNVEHPDDFNIED